ncbi:hypothetical protein FAP39_08575 [Shimia litoralis]|uniref:Uncharacterized protein n=1 Tax=Shimia litoralis TaxID=420403 RepID=A0A4V6F1Z5_9RHOB|nr:hypothetical protein [Shimia litoralis]TKZ20861.1 hypothetical protein FAP39_08575 [Shimia litoralis]
MSDIPPNTLHPMAPHHIPSFMPDAAGHDPMTFWMGMFMVVAILGLGTLYFRLHSLPEQMAHGVSGTQLQLVSILALIALFTHNNIFWVLALLLAAVKLPDYLTPLESIANSLKKSAAENTGDTPKEDGADV